ncbi:MAG: xylulokinase [Oscillospiraceae bacterium]|nr:xylulokinase [Oscillospiraceae bacterium]
MSDKYLIGIDVGTSGCKIIAVDEGRVVASKTVAYPLSRPKAGWSEQNPADWWEGVCTGLRAVTEGISDKIAGVSMSGQMHGMVALDKDLNVIRPAILWNDQRTEKQCDEITATAGGLDGLLGYTNNMMLTGYTGGKILWVKENEPENYARFFKVINPKDYIVLKLTGNLITDVSDASGTGFFDVEKRTWACELMDKCGIDRSFFADPIESTDKAGEVSAEASALTGIPAGVPVFAGGGDAVISTIAMGLTDQSKIGVTVGTSGVVAMSLPGYGFNQGGLLQMFCGNLPGSYVAFGCTLSAAGSYQWLHDALFPNDSFDDLNALAEKVPCGSDGLIFLPYLTGERCPLFDSAATGSFTGLSNIMGKGHFARAVMEGVALSLRQVYDLIQEVKPVKPNYMVVSGGGAKGQIWRQILADIFEMPVVTAFGSAEGGAYGAALIAGIGCGLWDAKEAGDLCAIQSVTEPIHEHYEIYRAVDEKYKRLYGSIKTAD